MAPSRVFVVSGDDVSLWLSRLDVFDLRGAGAAAGRGRATVPALERGTRRAGRHAVGGKQSDRVTRLTFVFGKRLSCAWQNVFCRVAESC